MTKTWKEVWEARRLDPARGSTLAQLMAADGMDTGFGDMTVDAFRRYVHATSATLGITPGSTVFEVGCGAGAYLYELDRSGCTVAGLDASSTLLGYARDVMPRGRWLHADAAHLDFSEPCDFVVANGVFLYFPSLDYAADVLHRMTRKARHGVMILDVPDLARRDEAMALRRQWCGEEDYAAKYDGLSHLYFDRKWFESVLVGCGMKPVRIDDQAIDGYANSAYRYNVFAWPALR